MTTPVDSRPPAGPAAAAEQYRQHLRGLQDAVADAEEQTRVIRAGQDAIADRHRDMATAIRDRVGEVWQVVMPALTPHGVTELDQIAYQVPDSVPPADEERGAQQAHQACRTALAQAAELKDLNRGQSQARTLVVVGGVILAFALAALLHGFGVLSGIPCVVVGGIAAVAPVIALRAAGTSPVLYAALLGAGTGGLGVLVTPHGIRHDPAGAGVAILAVLAAGRFGIFRRRR